MNSIYVVLEGFDFNDEHFRGTFSTMEKAKKFVITEQTHCVIIETILDAPEKWKIAYNTKNEDTDETTDENENEDEDEDTQDKATKEDAIKTERKFIGVTGYMLFMADHENREAAIKNLPAGADKPVIFTELANMWSKSNNQEFWKSKAIQYNQRNFL